MSSCEFASIRDAFGVTSFVSPEPPVLRGNVANISDSRQKKMRTAIEKAEEDAMQPAVGACFGAGNPQELERCSSGTTHPVCQACARKHPCVGPTQSNQPADVIWSTASQSTRRTLAWLAFRDVIESDGILLISLLVILYLLFKK